MFAFIVDLLVQKGKEEEKKKEKEKKKSKAPCVRGWSDSKCRGNLKKIKK